MSALLLQESLNARYSLQSQPSLTDFASQEPAGRCQCLQGLFWIAEPQFMMSGSTRSNPKKMGATLTKAESVKTTDVLTRMQEAETREEERAAKKAAAKEQNPSKSKEKMDKQKDRKPVGYGGKYVHTSMLMNVVQVYSIIAGEH